MSKRRSAYFRYLESAHWRNLRNQAFKRDGFKCIKCSSTERLHGHHKRYRKVIQSCTVHDIETLCEKCHEAHHREKARMRRINRKTRGTIHLISLLMNYNATDQVA